ncbi:MAG: FkbM family methyltransferase [Acidobacteriia bacterium]|nr:FkbM family methyltransferase [Terriglobia bacterium]
MSLARALAALLPSGAVKEFLRLRAYNLQYRGRARFSKAADVFTTRMAGTEFRTRQAPYGIPAMLDVYERWHRIAPGDVIIDVGAHYGMVMLGLAALAGPSGKILALEPDDINRRVLLDNLALNPELRQVEVLADALWDSVGNIEFCERGSLGSSALWDGPGSTKTTKRTITLDAVAERFRLERLDLVVMNAEGAELKAFAGAQHVLRELQPVFAIASNHFVDGKYTYETIERQLRSCGYEAETVWHTKEECVTYARPEPRNKA